MKPRLVHCVNVINFTHWGTVIILAVSMTACRTVRIIGTVRDHCGIPVAGVVVRAYCDTSVFSQSCVNGRHPLESCLQGIAVTDSHGHFAVPVSTSRAGQLLVEKHGFYPDKSSYAPEGTNYYDLRMTRRLMLTAKDLIRIKSIVGDELIADGLKALAFVVVGIMIYLAIRFEWKFAVAAIIANMHDVIIILGFFAFFQWEFSLPVLAAVLAVLGYSVNESVVIFDRVRENFRRYRKMTTVEIINNAITSTISRTTITHGSTQMMVLSMLLFGGATLHYFALALTIGILFGIYSSVFVAATIAMWLGIQREDMVKSGTGKPDIDPNDPNAGATV